jgi:endothelin-converting enzyme
MIANSGPKQIAYNPYDFRNLSQQLDFMSLSTYVSTFAPRNFPTKIIVTSPPYIESVHKILADTPDHERRLEGSRSRSKG